MTTARIAWTTPSATSSSNTVNTRPAASYPTAPGWPLTQASRRDVPRDRPRRKRPASSRATLCRPCSGTPIACALPPPSAWNTTSGASMPSSGSMSPPSADSKNRREASGLSESDSRRVNARRYDDLGGVRDAPHVVKLNVRVRCGHGGGNCLGFARTVPAACHSLHCCHGCDDDPGTLAGC